jgi:hypothetical protein
MYRTVVLVALSRAKLEISSDKCVQKYQKVSKGYKKGVLSEEEKKVLAENSELAVERAKKLADYQYPSTMVYKLLEELKGSEKGQISPPGSH